MRPDGRASPTIGEDIMVMATGGFEVTAGTEDPYDQLDGGIKLTHASGTQAFNGDIDGVGSVHWLMLYRPDRTATFVGLQRITATIDDRHGSFVASARGDHDGAGSRITFSILEGSGTGDLAGISGEGSLTTTGGAEGTYELDYRLGS